MFSWKKNLKIRILFCHILSLCTIILLTGQQIRVLLRFFMIFLPANIDLLLLPTDYRPSDYAHAFAKHIHNFHTEIKWKSILSNDTYNLLADAHHRHREFNKGENVMVQFVLNAILNMMFKSYMPISYIDWLNLHHKLLPWGYDQAPMHWY